MLDHMTFRVKDIERSKALYAAMLAPLGYVPAYDGVHAGLRSVGLGFADPTHPQGMKVDTWLQDGQSLHGHAGDGQAGSVPHTTACHLAWKAPNRAAVDAFYNAALAAGAKDNGPPGLRPHYHPHYYGAFVIDFDGNNVEAVCHAPE